MVFGSAVLHEPPPPVQEDAGTLSTVVDEVVLTVGDPEHPVPWVAPLHV